MAALLASSLEVWLSSQCDGPPDLPLQGLWTLLCWVSVGPLVLRTARELGGPLIWCLVTQMTSGPSAASPDGTLCHGLAHLQGRATPCLPAASSI